MDTLVCVSDYEKYARKILSKSTLDFYRSGAGQQTTLHNNKNAFARLRIRPRFLTNVSNRDLSTTVLGEKISMPIGISPTALQKLAHPDGECTNAKAAKANDIIFTLSTISTCNIEEVTEAAPGGLKWFQVFIYVKREITLNFIRRAEEAGFKAIVLTIDSPMVGLRLADARNKFTLPSHLSCKSVKMDSLVCVSDFEEYARKILSKNALDYYRSGAGQQATLYNNNNAFSRLRIRPRFLTNVSNRDLSTTVLGEKILMPIGISPTAMQRMAHPDGECANAKAAEAYGTIFTLSTIATSNIEQIAEAAPNGLKWFQLYIYIDREITLGLIRRAEKAGFKAIALTVDTPMFGLRLADIRNKFTLPSHLSLANFVGEKAIKINTSQQGSGLNNYVKGLFDTSLTWDDVKWLKSVTQLPIVVKGILTAEDAKIALEVGVQGIWVSNHGARQLDGVPASIEALPEIVKAVEGKVEVYLDGGVTDGTDVFKALALGAKMVFIGRPALWGLACNGEDGVKKILEILRQEFDFALALTGCSSVADIKKDMVVHESYYAKI